MLERAAQTNGSGLTFANPIYSVQGTRDEVHTCVRYRVSSSRNTFRFQYGVVETFPVDQSDTTSLSERF